MSGDFKKGDRIFYGSVGHAPVYYCIFDSYDAYGNVMSIFYYDAACTQPLHNHRVIGPHDATRFWSDKPKVRKRFKLAELYEKHGLEKPLSQAV